MLRSDTKKFIPVPIARNNWKLIQENRIEMDSYSKTPHIIPIALISSYLFRKLTLNTISVGVR